MEHFGQQRPSTSRIIVNGTLSPTNSPVVARTRTRQRTECDSLRNQHDKDSTKILGNSWHSPNQSTTKYLSHSHPSAVPNFGIGVTSSASVNTSIHNSLQSLPTLHHSLNNLPCQHGPGNTSHHVFGSKSVFGSITTQHKMPSHRNADNEEAMDIDAQEDMDMGHMTVAPLAIHTRTLRSTNTISTSLVTESESPKQNAIHSSRGWKELALKSKANANASEPTKSNKPSVSSVGPNTKVAKGPTKKRAIYIVLHASKVMIGTLHAKASAPIKIYAEKVFVEAELEDNLVMSLKIPCKDITHCTVSFELPKPIIAFTLSKTATKAVHDLNKEKGSFVDPDEQQGDHQNRLVLELNNTSLAREVKQDIIELFQKRFANQIKWKEVSSSEMRSLLHPKDKPTEETQDIKSVAAARDNNHTNKPEEPSSPPNVIPTRKILTPKKSRIKKGLFQDPTPSAPDASSSHANIATNTITQSPDKITSNVKCDVQENKIVTRSRRRKADEAIQDPSSPPKTSTSDSRDIVGKAPPGPGANDKCDINGRKKNDEENVEEAKERDSTCVTSNSERDILHHHSRIESHITLLGQHSEKQRHTLEHHQKLLTLEREERNRSIEKIQELQSTNREKQQFLLQQTETIDRLNREIESQKIVVTQLQQELGQERETSTRLRKVQTDLVQARRELEEERVVRGIRDKQLLNKENELAELRRVCNEERNLRQELNEELQRAQNTCQQHMDELENQRLFRQTQDRELQGREDRIQENERRYQEEHATRLSLEDELRRLRIENDELHRSRDSFQSELHEEGQRLCQERESFTQERQNYEQRIRDMERTVADSDRQIRELQAVLNASQSMMEENRRLEPRDWIIRREEVVVTDRLLGTGAWGSVKVGVFRGCKVAVKQIHELILSPHNRRLFEREMSIASRCRHPCLLQFIGATNDDGIPLFLTEILDTDLRAILSRRSLHQEEIIAIALDVARSLNYLHLNKPFPIIHRDISSSNVLLWKRDTCWRAKLSDYGAANFMRQCMTKNPGAGIYAAPEASTSQQSPKVDIYSFGLLLCEMCIRELPVPQQIQEQINLVTNGVLRELVMRCVQRDPEARPSMTEVITLLEQQEDNLLHSGLVSVNGRSATL